MILCDIGNTSAHIYENGVIKTLSFDKFKTYRPDEEVYYISVNSRIKVSANFKNLANLIKFKSTYKGLGVDRAFACYSITTGVVVDSGSATTIDVMNNGVHLGGVILPGFEAFMKSYESISPALKTTLNTSLSLDTLPQRTMDAISYGVLKSTISIISELSEGKTIYFTGGNGVYLSRFFESSIYNKKLVFDGMLKLLNEEGLC